MTLHDPAMRSVSAVPNARPKALLRPHSAGYALAVFAVTLFASALLLFAVQPMFTKMVLPILGGSPSVWSVAMVFFQACLLIGYAYAHLLARTLSVSRAALVHLAVLAAAALTLPIGIAQSFGNPPSTGIGIWLVGLFAASIGLPFIALSASAPLLQSWFATTGHPQARNPYVLYAASNLGSFVALLAYPLVIESLLPLRQQAWAWSVGFAVLAVFIAVAGVFAARGDAIVATADAGAAPTTHDRLGWIARAAIPVGLTIAVTAYISTDVAAAPLLWVLPLALYLLTFVAVFRDRPWLSHDLVIKIVPFLVAPLAISLLGGGDREYWFASIIINLAGLFVLSLACHGELYSCRPAPARLTEFYLWTSLGGLVGGIFAGLLAPYFFNRTYEYPILIVAALLALPGALGGGVRAFLVRMTPALAAVAVLIVLRFVVGVRLDERFTTTFQVLLVLLAVFMLLRRRDIAQFAGLAVVTFVVTALWQPGLNVVESTRSFFGLHRVLETSGGTHRIMYHGTTIHGAERVRESDGTPVLSRPEPLTYYYFGGPISEAVAAAREAQGGLNRVAVVGLGSGSLACHSKQGESWTFFEIDPEVVRLARDPNVFRFLSECAPAAAVVLGDARLTLKASQQQYDLIVLDAFSSDAIPVHLLTREALRGYLARLSPHGVIVMHISNRHMELLNVVAAVGAAEGLVTYARQDHSADIMKTLQANALVAALARREVDLGPLAQEGWHKADPSPAVAPWTDDYSDLIGAIWRRKFGS